MATLDIDVFPLFAGLRPDGSVFLQLAVGDDEHVSEVDMPASAESRRLAPAHGVSLDLDDLPEVAPILAREIDEFVAELKRRLILSAVQA